MQIVIYVIGVLAAILGLLSAAFFSVGHRDAGLWATCAAVVLVVIGGFAWYQEFLWERDADANKSDAAVKHARIVRVNTRLIVPESEEEGVRLAFGLINTGDADAQSRCEIGLTFTVPTPRGKSFRTCRQILSKSPSARFRMRCGMPSCASTSR